METKIWKLNFHTKFTMTQLALKIRARILHHMGFLGVD